MHIPRRCLILGLLALFLSLPVGLLRLPAQESPPRPNVRKLLYPGSEDKVPVALRPVVRKLLSPEQRPAEPADAKPAGVFVRVVSKKYILNGGKLKDGAALGDHPFVFVALPESLYGRSLLQVFSVIGYSADEVLGSQLGEPKVVVVFRWEDRVSLHPGRDGKLPEAWPLAVYPTTWDNIFALVGKMAADREWHVVRDELAPSAWGKLWLRSPRELLFLLGYPEAGKKRIKATSYCTLRQVGGADWECRSILERSLGLAEHFTGDGTSERSLWKPGKVLPGFPEFVGPNRALTALPEMAVIDLGALRATD